MQTTNLKVSPIMMTLETSTPHKYTIMIIAFIYYPAFPHKINAIVEYS